MLLNCAGLLCWVPVPPSHQPLTLPNLPGDARFYICVLRDSPKRFGQLSIQAKRSFSAEKSDDFWVVHANKMQDGGITVIVKVHDEKDLELRVKGRESTLKHCKFPGVFTLVFFSPS